MTSPPLLAIHRTPAKWRPRVEEAVVGLDESAGLESDLLDVAAIDLARLADLPDSVLANSLRRIIREGEAMSDQYAIFQNVPPE
jgi:FXSXX-COOH protein